MRDIFISYVEEDSQITVELAAALEAAGYSTWYYERDGMVGGDYLLETRVAIDQCQAFVLLLSPHSITSKQVDVEIVRAHETDKIFVPLRSNLTHKEFAERKPKWAQVIGSRVTTTIPPAGVNNIIPALLKGLETLRINSNANTTGPLRTPDPFPAQEARAHRPIRPVATFDRKRWLGTAGVALALMLVAVSGWKLWYRQPPPPLPLPKSRTSEFHEPFLDLNHWTAPATGWRTRGEHLYIGQQSSLGYAPGAVVGDFTMRFNLTLINGTGAAWALRVRDPNNYYLFYLAGPGVMETDPNHFYVYCVRDGKLNRPIAPIRVTQHLGPGGEYRIYIWAKGNLIKHFINPIDNPSSERNGDLFASFTDEENLFPSGSVGFRTVGGEQFAIADLHVWPPEVRSLAWVAPKLLLSAWSGPKSRNNEN